jgi:peptide chain release factor 2
MDELMFFGGIFDLDRLNERIKELEFLSADPKFWDDQKRSTTLLREKSDLERSRDTFLELISIVEDADTLLELGEEELDDELLQEAKETYQDLEVLVSKAEVRRMLSEETDENDAILEINSGAGGTEAADWASMLKRMYLHWASSNGYKSVIIDEHPHEEAGLKNCTIEIKGQYAYGYLKSEIGVHRLVRISPFDSNSRRHTSFASVNATPAIDDDIDVDIKEVDLRIDTYRASGAGGQHVNTTDSAVRITHLPTNIVVACQNERSQHKNKARAMQLLKSKLYQYELQKRQEAIDEKNAEKKKIEWGSQIRSYVLHPYKLIKDLRTGFESSNVDKVLSGDLNGYMESWLGMNADNNES